MTTKEKDVFSKQVKVGVASFACYDSVAEAVGALGEKDALDLLNAQARTNAMNEVREMASPKVSKKALRTKAMAMITADEFIQIAGDSSRIEELIQAKVKMLEAALPPVEEVEAGE